QNLLTDEAGLHLFALGLDQSRCFPLLFVSKESLVVALLGELNNFVGQVQNGLRAAVVFFEFDNAGARKRLGKIHDISEIGAAKRVDTLRIVSHDSHVIVRGGQQPDDLRLKSIGILILVDHDELVNLGKPAAHLFMSAKKIFQLGQKVVVV